MIGNGKFHKDDVAADCIHRFLQVEVSTYIETSNITKWWWPLRINSSENNRNAAISPFQLWMQITTGTPLITRKIFFCKCSSCSDCCVTCVFAMLKHSYTTVKADYNRNAVPAPLHHWAYECLSIAKTQVAQQSQHEEHLQKNTLRVINQTQKRIYY
jgi:hypothetical protein